MGVILSFVVILSFWERCQNKGFSGYWLKHKLIWEKGFVFAFLEKVIGVYTPSRVIWIKFDRGTPPPRTRFQRIKQKGYLDDTKILFWDLYITDYTALVSLIIRHAELTCLISWCLGLSAGSSQDTDIRDCNNHWGGLLKANQLPHFFLPFLPFKDISTPIFSLKKLWRVIIPVPWALGLEVVILRLPFWGT